MGLHVTPAMQLVKRRQHLLHRRAARAGAHQTAAIGRHLCETINCPKHG
jgi:hypothetical protein